MNKVSLVTLTEFGRRADENGSGGVDHGFGQAVLLLGGGHSRRATSTAHGRVCGRRSVDGDLERRNDYRKVLAELLEKRCEAASVTDVFPGIDGTRFGIATQA